MKFQFQFQLQLQGGRIDETALESIVIRVGEYDLQEMTKEEKEDEDEAQARDAC